MVVTFLIKSSRFSSYRKSVFLLGKIFPENLKGTKLQNNSKFFSFIFIIVFLQSERLRALYQQRMAVLVVLR